MEKLESFEYLTHKISQWNFETTGSYEVGLNILKIIKLHFFICAVESKPEGNDLFDLFDNFHALPLGPVESDVYNSIKRGDLQFFQIGKNKFERIREYDNEKSLDPSVTQLIDNSLFSLKTINPQLIKYSAYQLVDLSHLWSSWNSIFTYAKSLRKFSEKIPVEIIRHEQKIFSL